MAALVPGNMCPPDAMVIRGNERGNSFLFPLFENFYYANLQTYTKEGRIMWRPHPLTRNPASIILSTRLVLFPFYPFLSGDTHKKRCIKKKKKSNKFLEHIIFWLLWLSCYLVTLPNNTRFGTERAEFLVLYRPTSSKVNGTFTPPYFSDPWPSNECEHTVKTYDII